MSVSLQKTYYHLNEEGEFVTVSIYASDETGKLSIWAEDPEDDAPSMFKFVPDTIDEAIEWYEQQHDIKLSSSMTDDEGPELEEVITEDEAKEIAQAHVTPAPFDVSQTAILDAASLATLIQESIDSGAHSSELDLQYDSDTGGFSIVYGQAYAQILIGFVNDI